MERTISINLVLKFLDFQYSHSSANYREDLKVDFIKFIEREQAANTKPEESPIQPVSGRSELLLAFGEFMSKQPFMISKRRMPEYIEEFLKANNSH